MQKAPVQPLKPWFQTIQDLPSVLDWGDFFATDQPVELDIGCGRGLFLTNAAVQNPQRNFLGLEIDYREGRRSAKRLQKRELGNARVIGGDGNIVLRQHIAPATVAAAHVYFPDPWWKTRHQKRRIWNPDFLNLLARVLIPGGQLHSWTDVADYDEEIEALLVNDRRFAPQPAPAQRPAEHDLDYQTSFERKKRQLGLPIYRRLWHFQPTTDSE